LLLGGFLLFVLLGWLFDVGVIEDFVAAERLRLFDRSFEDGRGFHIFNFAFDGGQEVLAVAHEAGVAEDALGVVFA
jgi:hypothetical protein